MGISKEFAEVILSSCKFNPFSGQAFVVGRQTILLTEDELLELASKYGVKVSLKDLVIDDTTKASFGHNYITDRSFMKLCGVSNLQSIDVSDYEGATIVHDLNKEIPLYLKNCADLIIDGSTLDNVFDPVMVLKNLSKMLKPGGRLFSCNMGSNYNCPYFIPTPSWFYDYFVVNNFFDVNVYVVVYSVYGTNVFILNDQTEIPTPPHFLPNLTTEHMMVIIVEVTKGTETATEVIPIQQQYRSFTDNTKFVRNAKKISSNKKSPGLKSTTKVRFVDTPAGYTFLDGV